MKNLKRYNQLFENTQELTQEQKDWLDKCTKGTWSVNPKTGLVDVEGSFDCQRQGLTDFNGVKFGNVSGYFICYRNELKSLDGAPQSVGTYFDCGNNELKSLEGLPDGFRAGLDFFCHNNDLTSLKGAPQSVGGGFYCDHNNLTSLKGAPQSVGSIFDCSYNSLTSLEGAPQSVGGDFNCGSNGLKSLEGLPAGFKVIRNFRCYDNELKSLEGLPDGFKVGGGFYCSDNSISKRAINGVVQRMGDKKISLEQAVAGYWRDIPREDRVYLAKSAFNSTVIEDPEIVSSEDAIQIYLDTSLQFSRSEREEYKKKLSRRGDIDQEMIDGLDSMVRILNRHK